MKTVLIVCSANRCRSPMAEALLREMLETEAESWRVLSAGTWAGPDRPATELAEQVMAEKGMDLGGHHSQAVSAALLAQSELVLVMEQAHKRWIVENYPEQASKVHLLTEFAGVSRQDVEDPFYGGSLDGYRLTVQELEHLLQRALPAIRNLTHHAS